MPSDPVRADNEINRQVMLFIEKISHYYLHLYKVPHIAGHILGLLLITPQPISMKDIARLLDVSQASVSTNLRLLVMLGLVEELHVGGSRSTSFRFVSCVCRTFLTEQVNQHQKLKQTIETNRQKLCLSEDLDQRLDEMVTWSDLAIKKYSEFIVEWETISNKG